MPAIGNLDGLRQRPGRSQRIAAPAFARDNADLGLCSKPGLGRRWLTIRQQGNRLAPFEVADDCSVPVVAPLGPIINTDHRRRYDLASSPSSHDTQHGVIAGGNHQAARELRRRSPAQGKAEAVNDVTKPSSSPCPW